MARGKGRGHMETLPSGSTRVTWYAPDGARTRRTFTDRDDAEDWLAERRIEVKRGIWQPPKPEPPLLNSYALTWISQRRNRKGLPLKPRTQHEYRALLRGPLAELGRQRIDQIAPWAVRAWYATLDDHPAQQANAYGLLSAILSTAVEDEIITSSPCRIRGGGVKDRASETTPLTPAQVAQLADAMPAHLRAAVLVSAYCGLRFGEMAALCRQDVAPDGTEIRVRVGVTWTKGETHTLSPKSDAGRRPVVVPPHVAPVLARHLDVWTGSRDEALVFTSTRGSQLRSSTLARSFYRARAEIGRTDLRWHDLRHTGATMATQAGATLKEVQVRIGHSTVAAAMRYQHATNDRDRQVAEKMSELATSPPVLRVVT